MDVFRRLIYKGYGCPQVAVLSPLTLLPVSCAPIDLSCWITEAGASVETKSSTNSEGSFGSCCIPEWLLHSAQLTLQQRSIAGKTLYVTVGCEGWSEPTAWVFLSFQQKMYYKYNKSIISSHLGSKHINICKCCLLCKAPNCGAQMESERRTCVAWLSVKNKICAGSYFVPGTVWAVFGWGKRGRENCHKWSNYFRVRSSFGFISSRLWPSETQPSRTTGCVISSLCPPQHARTFLRQFSTGTFFCAALGFWFF